MDLCLLTGHLCCNSSQHRWPVCSCRIRLVFYINVGFLISLTLVQMYSIIDSLRFLGDMMGPFAENLENKIQKPFGCGEQNIKSLTPSIFVGPYLEAIKKLDQETRDKLKRYCEQGILLFFY